MYLHLLLVFRMLLGKEQGVEENKSLLRKSITEFKTYIVEFMDANEHKKALNVTTEYSTPEICKIFICCIALPPEMNLT